MISEVELKQIADKVGTETADKIKQEFITVEKNVNDKMLEAQKGLMKAEDFESYKKDQMESLNQTLKEVKELREGSEKQGIQMASLLEKGVKQNMSIDDFLVTKKDAIKECYKSRTFMEITGEELKAAGVYSIANTINPSSPYAPGIGGAPLEIFDIMRNPNFITSKVNLGRTDQSLMAWANETSIEGGADIVAEGATKPQVQHVFSIETSTAKKVAAWSELTEEFDQDLPQFSTKVRRLLQTDTLRVWDDKIQLAVQAAARAYTITGLDGKISFANYWDALNAMAAQVGTFNFNANTFAYNYITKAIIEGQKTTQGEYLLPAFAQDMLNKTVYANKMADYYALVGDLQQYNVDIYKDYVLKVGWINDEFVNNKFAILGEIRYHNYISDARKNALVYDSLDTVVDRINKA